MYLQPHPSDLETTFVLRDGRSALVRPIRHEDASALLDMFDRSSEKDLYYRFFHVLRKYPQQLAVRLTHIDYDHEMAFGAFIPISAAKLTSPISPEEMIGIVHLLIYPERDTAEFAVMIRSDMKGKGIGYFLMSHIIAYAAGKGVQTVIGHVLRNNPAMLAMSHELGFECESSREDEQLVRVVRRLDDSQSVPATQ